VSQMSRNWWFFMGCACEKANLDFCFKRSIIIIVVGQLLIKLTLKSCKIDFNSDLGLLLFDFLCLLIYYSIPRLELKGEDKMIHCSCCQQKELKLLPTKRMMFCCKKKRMTSLALHVSLLVDSCLFLAFAFHRTYSFR
jgi:hypothetical protein